MSLALLGALILGSQWVFGSPLPQEPSGPPRDPVAILHDSLSKAVEASAAIYEAATRPPEISKAAESTPVIPEAPPQDRERAYAERYWSDRKAELREALGRLAGLRPALEPILAQEGVPPGLLAMVLVESAAQPNALSPKGARGLWQFIPETAARYGLLVKPRQDDRLDPAVSTRAAARYLRDLHARFADWELALAAYNAGEQAVSQAVLRAGTANFDALSQARLLPEETRVYVRAVLDAMALLDNTISTGGSAEKLASQPAGSVVFAVAVVGGSVIATRGPAETEPRAPSPPRGSIGEK
jgi:membrane-bound lytic murein transglycosylase D